MMFLNKKNVCFSAFVGVFVFSVPTAKADSVLKEEWKFHVAPYLWAPKSNSVMKSSKGPLSEPLSESWDNSKVSAFINGSARKGPYVFLADTGYSSLSENMNFPYGIQAKVKVKQTYFTLTGGYSLSLNKNNSFDLMGGVRWWHLKGNVSAEKFGFHEHLNKSFATTILAVNWIHKFNDEFTSALYFDHGGIISKTNKTNQVVALTSYKISNHTTIALGYRLLEVDYRENNKRLDLKQKGPFVSALFKF